MPIAEPTRRQKKCWRRRVSRAANTYHQGRGVTYDVAPDDTLVAAILEYRGERRRLIRAPWER